MKKEEEDGIEELNEGVDELSEDISDIGKDTDKILLQMSTTLKELVDNTKETKSTKKWVITLFIADKAVILLMLYLSIKIL